MIDERDCRTGPRWLLAILTVATTCVAAWTYWSILLAMATGPIWTSALLTLFVALFVWIAFSFWMATAGFIRMLICKTPTANALRHPEDFSSGARTAILMPIYNESPHRVFAGVRAIYESLQATGSAGLCDFFILSDTTNPDIWLAEEVAWARLRSSLSGDTHVYYRHRPKNVARKSGNIADFCERWGATYRYMVVLDADSVMSGRTIIELIYRMEQDPQIGILQAPPVPVNRWSLFARCQQFAASVYGSIFLEGFAWWTGDDGNYWGHNAIIRVDAFTQACGLPKLTGDGPLGGEILSHDFVEAALIRRAGYKVRLATDLDGSFEECPPTLIAYAQRDQRWCQGNLQHIRLIASAGLHSVSRLHLTMGAVSYLASPLWLLFLTISFLAMVLPTGGSEKAIAAVSSGTVAVRAIGLFAATMAMLLLPKLWSYIVLVSDAKRRIGCGGAFKALISVLLETATSVMVAPILMAFHTVFVVTTLLGHRVQWNAQARDENGQAFWAAVAVHWKQTAVATMIAIIVWMLAPQMLPWLSPILAGLLLAVPLSILLSSVAVGRFLSKYDLLRTPEEIAAPEVLKRHRHFLAIEPPKELLEPQLLFRRLLTDPALLALHRCVLDATESCVQAPAEVVAQVQRQLLSGGPQRVSTENRKILLSDPAALDALHLFVWTTHAPTVPNGEVEPAYS